MNIIEVIAVAVFVLAIAGLFGLLVHDLFVRKRQ
jgi:hypothetical protein